MLASFASLTPNDAVPLFGRGGPPRNWARIASGLEANLISFPSAGGRILVVGLDTLFASSAFKAQVLARLDPPVRGDIEDLILVATHTHNAPALDPTKPSLGGVDQAYFAFCVDMVVGLVTQAVEQGQKTVARFLRGMDACRQNASRRKRGWRLNTCPPYVERAINMVPRHGPDVPREMEIAVACCASGSPLWAIWSWACHATASPDANAICADFPGRVRAHIRDRLGAPALPVVYLPGFCGDIRPDPSFLPIPLRSLASRPLQRPFASQTASNYDRLCAVLAATTDRILDKLRPAPIAPRATLGRSDIPLGDLIAAPAGFASSQDVTIRALSLGDFGMLLVSAEVCSPYLTMLRSRTPPGWILSGYSDQVFGYLPSDRQIEEGGYESNEFFRTFDLDGAFVPHVQDLVFAAAEHAVADCLSEVATK